MEPAYYFTLPSIADDTVLDCRLYHPEGLSTTLLSINHDDLKAAIIAHPYAPLGGSYDDPVVLVTTAHLVKQGYIVATFNFRGAGESKGHTSWSAYGEKQDFMTVIGFALQYVRALVPQTNKDHVGQVELLLAGYSYGSLVLSRLPPIDSIEQRFDTADLGSNTAEIILRAKRLATDVLHTARESEVKRSPRGRPHSASSLKSTTSSRSRAHSLTVTLGGEESAERRHSKPRMGELIKKGVEVPQRIRLHLRRDSSSKSEEDLTGKASSSASQTTLKGVKLRYLLISPLLPPISHALMPSLPMTQLFGHSELRDPSTGFGSLKHPILVVYGDADGFTSAKKLGTWTEKLASISPGMVRGADISSAGHFWREHGVMDQLQETIMQWLRESRES